MDLHHLHLSWNSRLGGSSRWLTLHGLLGLTRQSTWQRSQSVCRDRSRARYAPVAAVYPRFSNAANHAAWRLGAG
ncbi:Uncharacterised protein [Vibrio cholerae]|nr:Uncharacterised protein [Vibrio cholerae]CSB39391.1 Uncharacterised protein [Vibrio cholerae]CSD11274.1 Uncharacterised protein [Vibrio cholerae]